jgi:hypothetical protein
MESAEGDACKDLGGSLRRGSISGFLTEDSDGIVPSGLTGGNVLDLGMMTT